jgi:hypothetical protein
MRAPRYTWIRRTTSAVALTLPLVVACSSPTEEKPAPAGRTYTFKALAGISMGGIGATFLAGTGDNHKKLDAVAPMGGPIDVAYFLSGFERNQIGGFCPLNKLEGLLNENADALNDPNALTCERSTPLVGYEHNQDFNHWKFTTDGGTFDRSSYLGLFYDISLALGNPLYYNPESPLFPAPGITKESLTPALCKNPIKFNKGKGNAIYNKEYNPEGKYDVITFCDGEEPVLYCNDAAKTPVDFCAKKTPEQFCTDIGATQVLSAGKSADQNSALFYAKKGAYDPCWEHDEPVSFGLAVDLNGNGRRDYHEPVVVNAHERFQDTGVDGCANDREDGKGGCTASGQTGDPNSDDFDPVKNPLGTEQNFLRDEGEAYEDFGLDGVANTEDYGEGNGKYDDGPNRQNWLKSDFRQNYMKWSEQERKNIDVYADGGIRDVFNFGLSADMMTSATRALEPQDSKRYTQYEQMPSMEGQPWDTLGGFQPLDINFALVGRNLFIRYGKENATNEEYRKGDGDHVGTPGQVLNRFQLFVKWMSFHWERVLGEPGVASGNGQRLEITYFSEKLGAYRNFGIALPPGYDDPKNANVRYPVFTLGHGYGMDSAGMTDINLIFDGFSQNGSIIPMIGVYPSGRCCFVKPDGTRDCRETDETTGEELEKRPGYVRECRKGNFYVNRQGFSAGDATAYGDSMFEIFDYVDKNFRTLAPVTLEK